MSESQGTGRHEEYGMDVLSGEDIQAMQFARLQAQLERVATRSPYYRAKFARHGVEVRHFKRLDDLRHFPFFDKDEERISQERSAQELGHCLGLHITCDIRDVNRISASSGTTGKPTFTGFTRRDRDVQATAVARMCRRAGIEPGDVVMHAGVLSMWIAGVPMVDGLMSYGACVVPLGGLTGAERFFQIASDTRPRVVMLTPSYALHLIKGLGDKGLSVATLGIKKLLVYGEPGGSIPETRRQLSSGFGGAEVFDVMGATGAHSPTSLSCEEGAGLHFFAGDSCYFELVHPKTLEPIALEDGAEGEVVYTGMEKECGPLIRWRDRDIVQVFMTPCRCGRPGFRYIINGRSDDMLLVKGVNVYPHAVRDVVLGFRPRVTGAMRIVKHSPSAVMVPPVLIKVERGAQDGAASDAQLAGDIEERLHDLLRFRSRVELHPPGALQESVGDTFKAQLFERAY